MKVGFVQNSPLFLAVAQNIANCFSLIQGKKAELWVLPEFFATGYVFRNKREVATAAENIPRGPTTQSLIRFSVENKCAVVAGLPEKQGRFFYNSAVLVQGRKVRVYRKSHLFGTEKKFFKPGNTGFWVDRVAGARVGVMICFDWFFPESARTLSLKGAQIIAHPSNLVLPWGPEGMKIRSLENRVFSVTADRIGTERGLKFIGQSQVVSPAGKLLVRAGSDRTVSCVVDIPPKDSINKQVTPQNHLFRDRRPALYL